MKTRIVIDSSCDTTVKNRGQLTIVPLNIHFGEEEYVDGVTITPKDFYEKLENCEHLPKTSQASPVAFMNVYEEAVKAGEDVVVITIASKLSGTFQSAVIAAEEYEGKVFVIDSENAAIGSGVLVERALQLANQGMRGAQIAKILDEEKKNIRLVALLDTLEYLKMGGRISKTAALAGGLLSIKPIIEVKDGVIETIGKARGAKQGNNFLVKEIEKANVDFDKPVLLGYTGNDEGPLQKFIQDSISVWEGNIQELPSTGVCSVIGTHAGPGAVAAAYFVK